MTTSDDFSKMPRPTTTIHVTAQELRDALMRIWDKRTVECVFLYGHVPERVQVGGTMLVVKKTDAPVG
jgi:hypothetical protein